MAEHFCKEHEVAFTMKKNKEGEAFWSHKTDDGWCNEPKENKPKPEAYKSKEIPERQTSIEVQNAYSGVPALVELLNKYPTNQLALAAQNYAMSKLGLWSSTGGAVPEEARGDSPTQAQLNEIYKIAKEKGYTKQGNSLKVLAIMMSKWDIANSKALNKDQADELITLLKEGYMLNEKEEPEKDPKDVPNIPF